MKQDMINKVLNKAKELMPFCLFTLLPFLASCNDYLEVTPTNTLTTDNFYATPAQCDQALTGVYGAMKPLPKYLFSMSEIRSDNVWARVDVKQNDYVDVCTFNANGLLTDDIVKGCWSDYFKVVAAANVFIEKMQDTDVLTASQKEQYMAEARFLRAYAYWPQNYPLLRLEDVMLLYAECVGATTEGYDMVNRIRQRAGLSALSGLTEAQFQDAVANERRYELAEEGHRWFDLVRQEKYVETLQAMFAYNDDTTTGTYKAFASRVTKDMYLYPIPQSQIEVRAGLYSQNPGY